MDADQMTFELAQDNAASGWISCSTRPPVGEDFGCFSHSVDVLFTDGSNQWVGYLQTWKNEEYDPEWKIKGPDGWNVENVSHWMPLLSLPNTPAHPPPLVDPRFARFGEALWEYITKRGGDFCNEEISEDILPLAEAAGLCCRAAYDPKIHGDMIDAEPGCEIWWWGNF